MAEDIRTNIRNAVYHAVDRSGLLTYEARFKNKVKADLNYQYDNYIFQKRRALDPGFFRYIFKVCRESPNFLSERQFLLKTFLTDISKDDFRIKEVSGSPKPYHTKNKEGDFEPRHARRIVRERMDHAFSEQTTHADDQRFVTYQSVFNPRSRIDASASKTSKDLWATEVQNTISNEEEMVALRHNSTLIELLPEVWEDRRVLSRESTEIIKRGPFGDTDYAIQMSQEISSFSDIFRVFCNNMNSLAEINWFMGKEHHKRASFLKGRYPFAYTTGDLDKVLGSIKNLLASNEDYLKRIAPEATSSFLWLRIPEISERFMNIRMSFSKDEKEKCVTFIERTAFMRDIGKKDLMLESGRLAVSFCQNNSDPYSIALAKIRYAEALCFNGMKKEGIELLSEVDRERGSIKGSHLSMSSEKRNAIEGLKEETYTELDTEVSMPGSLAILLNLRMVAERIKECRLEIEYLESAFTEGKEFLQSREGTNHQIYLSSRYSQLLYNCS